MRMQLFRDVRAGVGCSGHSILKKTAHGLPALLENSVTLSPLTPSLLITTAIDFVGSFPVLTPTWCLEKAIPRWGCDVFRANIS